MREIHSTDSLRPKRFIAVTTVALGTLSLIYALANWMLAQDIYVPVLSGLVFPIFEVMISHPDTTDPLMLPVFFMGFIVAIVYLRSWRVSLLYVAALVIMLKALSLDR